MNPQQLREQVIRPTLKRIGLWSQAAEDLILGTACQESHCGKYIRQLGCKGAIGAFGVWQMELATARDIYDNFLRYKPDLKAKVESLRNPNQELTESLTTNLMYACAMCRIHYLRVPEPLPTGTIESFAKYYKKYYNTIKGKATEQEYINNWNKYANAK